MRRVLGRAFTSAPLVACSMILLGLASPSAIAQVPRPPAGTYYYYPAPGTAGPSSGYAAPYSYEPAPVSNTPSPGYYYYPQMPSAGLAAGYYYYPGPGYVAPPQGTYYYYQVPSAGTTPTYTRPTPAYARPSPVPMIRRFGFPIPANRSPQPGEADDYAYKS